MNSRTQSMVYDDLGMSKYVIINDHSSPEGGLEMKTKQRADILECKKSFSLFSLSILSFPYVEEAKFKCFIRQKMKVGGYIRNNLTHSKTWKDYWTS